MGHRVRGRWDGAGTGRRVLYEDEHQEPMVVSRLLVTC